ncbi:MAG: molybdate ABC transporter substrate-binding protein [Pseudomonadota bacterium]|jgi:molybdenum ABC transporter, periplasmic molybdate-binding protein|nr:MAG: molybdate ABC transporter substrate-binding protein [Pseudomonadota bacterium]
MSVESGRSALRSVLLTVFGALALLPSAAAANAQSAVVAVSANFTDTAKELWALFEKETGHRVVLSFGSTGQLYAQISQGAPYDVFLAADDERTKTAIEAGFAVEGTEFTYATGRLVLYSSDPGFVTGEDTLRKGEFQRLAIANPTAAPYGAAAIETLKALGVYEALAPKIVQGVSITQVYQFVDTGNAEVGFVALSQINGREKGSSWLVPQNLHAPIAQNAVLLKHGEKNPVAREFLSFLRGEKARAVIEKFGYATGTP